MSEGTLVGDEELLFCRRFFRGLLAPVVEDASSSNEEYAAVGLPRRLGGCRGGRLRIAAWWTLDSCISSRSRLDGTQTPRDVLQM